MLGNAASGQMFNTKRKQAKAELTENDIAEILAVVTPYSMVHESGTRFTIEQTIVRGWFEDTVPGLAR